MSLPDFLSEWPYVAWALATASGFYWLFFVAERHMTEDSKAAVSLWLQGDFAGTWSDQFCRVFDGVFTENHLGLRCILRSMVFSVVAVLAIYVLLDQVLGILDLRAGSDLALWQVLAIGAAVNLVPDYVSLYQTRWILGRFRTLKSIPLQVAVLLADLLLSGLIIFLGINAFQLLMGESLVSLPEVMFLFSVYAVFFYSTFLTSIWAWLYCLSSWVIRGFVALRLPKVLDVQKRPMQQLALLAGVLGFAGALAVQPVVRMDAEGQSALDGWVCQMFPVTCRHVLRLTADQERQLEILEDLCGRRIDGACMDDAQQNHGIDDQTATDLYRHSCNLGNMRACNNLGFHYSSGRGVPQDDVEAARLYRLACDGEDAGGCSNLGLLYANGRGVSQDDVEASRLYRLACDGGEAWGCSNLGFQYANGRGVPQDDVEAARLYRQGCDGGEAWGCSNLGFQYANGRGVPQDDVEAARLFRQGCDGGDAMGCTNLGFLYLNGRGVPQDHIEAARLYRQACDGGDAMGCTNLGWQFANGWGVTADLAEAVRFYRLGCEGDVEYACELLTVLSPPPL